jgi:MFS family permease
MIGRYGRKYSFLGTVVCLVMGTIVSAVAPNMYVYAVARFLCGVGFAGKIITYNVNHGRMCPYILIPMNFTTAKVILNESSSLPLQHSLIAPELTQWNLCLRNGEQFVLQLDLLAKA